MADFKATFSEEAAEFKTNFTETINTGGSVSGVSSVNGKTGAVIIVAADVGAYTKEQTDKLGNEIVKSIYEALEAGYYTSIQSDERFANKEEVPKKISDLVDDTIENPVAVAHSALQTNNANEAIIANKAIFDNEGNMIHITYATKAELLEAIGEALEGDY